MSTVYEPPPARHDCRDRLPDRAGGFGSTGVEDGTVAECGACGRWWVSLPCYEHYGPTSRWYRVGWWQPRARRRVKAILAKRNAPPPGRPIVKVCPPLCARRHGHVWSQALADRLNRYGPPLPPPGRGAASPTPRYLSDHGDV